MCTTALAVSLVAERTQYALSVREVKVRFLIPWLVKLAQCCQQLTIVVTFLQSCVAQVLSCGDGPHHSLQPSA